MTAETSQTYCRDRVREYDYDRYFAAAFAEPERRRALFALYAFNLEIASVRERVSEPVIGQMRLQWWRDALDGIYEGNVRAHAVAEELADAVGRYALSRETLGAMVDAREFDLEDEPPEDLAALTRYAAATSGNLAVLAAAICGGGDGESGVSKEAGTVWALAGILRAVPFHAATGKVYLPREVLRRAEVRPKQIIDSAGRSGVENAVLALLPEVGTRLAAARRGLAGLPKPARPAVGYLPIAVRYLKELEAADGNVFGGVREPGPFGKQLRIAAACQFGRF